MSKTAQQPPPTKEQLDKALGDAVRLGNLARVIGLIEQAGCDPDANVAGHPMLTLAVKLKLPKVTAALLEYDAKVNATNPDGDTALHLATRASKGDFVSLLLDSGADALQKNTAGDVAADIALRGTLESRQQQEKAHNNDKPKYREQIAKWGEVLQAIAAHKDFDATAGCDGKPYIVFAVEASTPGLVATLLEKGADINSTDASGNTPLILAAKECRDDFTTLLLEKGADLNKTNAAGDDALTTVLKTAAARVADEPAQYDFNLKDHRDETSKWEALATTFTQHEKFNPKGAPGGQPYITLAAQLNNTQFVESLLAKGADVDAVDTAGDTPLLKAARCGNKEMAEFLLAKGANALHANAAGETLQSLALQGAGDYAENGKGHQKHKMHVDRWSAFTLFALCMKGYNLDARASGTPLVALATRLYETDTLRSLLLRGASIDAPAENGDTALMRATRACRHEFAALLLEKGASRALTNKAGEAPTGVAMKGAVDFLDTLGKDLPEDKANKEQWQRWEKLIELLTGGIGYNPNAMGGGRPLLALAARFNSTAALKSLMDAGATVEAKATDGDTALIVATRHCHPEHAKLLLDAGASAFTQNAAGETAKQIAIESEEAHLQTRPSGGKTWDEHEVTRKKWDALVDMLDSQQQNALDSFVGAPAEAVTVRTSPLKLKMKAKPQ